MADDPCQGNRSGSFGCHICIRDLLCRGPKYAGAMVEGLDSAAKIGIFQDEQMGLVLLEWHVYLPLSASCRELTELCTYCHQMGVCFWPSAEVIQVKK